MNKYQVVMPNGDIAVVAADRMENKDGDLSFFVKNEAVGEFRYWHAWNLVETITVQETKTPPPKVDASALRDLVSGPPDDPVTTFAQALAAKIDPYSGRS